MALHCRITKRVVLTPIEAVCLFSCVGPEEFGYVKFRREGGTEA